MKEHSNDRDKAEQSAHQRKNRGKGRAKRVWGVIGTIVLVGVLTMAIFVGIFMTYINKSLKGHVEVDMSEYDRKVSTELYRLGTDGETWEMYQTLFSDENRIWVDIGDIPEYLQEATIAIEDKRFKTHHGVDWRGTLRAITSTLTGSGTQGGSTITQQLIKNLTQYDRRQSGDGEAEDHGDLPGAGAGEGLLQVPDPGDVSQHHLSGRAVLRRADGCPDVLPQGCEGPDAGGVCLSHRHHQQSLHV